MKPYYAVGIIEEKCVGPEVESATSQLTIENSCLDLRSDSWDRFEQSQAT